MGEDSDLLVSTKQIQIMATRRRETSVDIHAGGNGAGLLVWISTRAMALRPVWITTRGTVMPEGALAFMTG